MVVAYKTVYEGKTAEVVEKKSRFIANVYFVDSEEAALNIIESVKKKYWDARHNCYAYVLGEDARVQRFSDDGEPSQTAGKPMLDVIMAEEIRNVLVVVTRYFGGTLLGTGGLVRAYSKATKDALLCSTIIEKIRATKLIIKTDYNGMGKINYIINQLETYPVETRYTESVEIEVVVPDTILDTFKKKVIEATSAKAEIDGMENDYFAILDGKVINV